MKTVKWLLAVCVGLVGVLATNGAYACTAAVISGRVTPDGRPLMWKQRDTDFRQNCVACFSGSGYSFVAVVNSVEEHPEEVWIGTNEAGFSIMNTQSYNLVEVAPGEERGAANGRMMKRALEVCATVQDFCLFLDTLSRPMMVEANVGVIDAQGGAALFEVDYYKYIMYDANNAKDAPCGYIARTNFSFAGGVNAGAGYVRYMQEDKLLMPASAMKLITPQWIFEEAARSFANPILGIDLKSGQFNRPRTTGWFVDQDFIARRSTASSVVVQGVKKGEHPELTTMWTVLGYPPTGVAVPVWVKGAVQGLPSLLARDALSGEAPAATYAMRLADTVFSYSQGMGTDRYFDWEKLHNASGTGLMQRLVPLERRLFSGAEQRLEQWRSNGRIDEAEMRRLYEEQWQMVTAEYETIIKTIDS